jgi:hypothetical protein
MSKSIKGDPAQQAWAHAGADQEEATVRIFGITVSVNYADLLAAALPTWLATLDGLMVVTTPEDEATVEACAKALAETPDRRARGVFDVGHGLYMRAMPFREGPGVTDIQMFKTNAFYDDGAVFNKGKVMAEAMAHLDECQETCGFRLYGPPASCLCRKVSNVDVWIATFDADVVPPQDWREVVEGVSTTVASSKVLPGVLYGAYRCWRETKDDPWRLFEEYEVAGFFQLWHARDPHVLGEDGSWTHPFYDPHWRHAGGYDSAHAMRWSVNQQVRLPIVFEHEGVPGQNWWGRGNADAMAETVVRRHMAGGIDEEFERLPGAPAWQGGWRLG